MQDILEIQNISRHFGGVKAVNNCSFTICKNSITGLIGPNGAGKTTMFNLISGLLSPDEGNIYYLDQDITSLNSFQRAHLGFGRSYQSIRLFSELSALENVVIAFKNCREKLWHSFCNYNKNQKSLEKKAMELLSTVGLEEKANLKAFELSYGQKKMLEILRCKAAESDFILLDEPTAGINPVLIKKITGLIKDFQQEGKTIFIVEHNMPFIMNLCERIIVMDMGKEIAIGKPEEIQGNALVLEAYLGRRKKLKFPKSTNYSILKC